MLSGTGRDSAAAPWTGGSVTAARPQPQERRGPESQRPEDPRVRLRFLGRYGQESLGVLPRPEAAVARRSSPESPLPFECPASGRRDRKANLRAPPSRNGRARHGSEGGSEWALRAGEGLCCRPAASGGGLSRGQSLRRQKTVSASPRKARTQAQRSGPERGPRRRSWRQAEDGGRGFWFGQMLPPGIPTAAPAGRGGCHSQHSPWASWGRPGGGTVSPRGRRESPL